MIILILVILGVFSIIWIFSLSLFFKATRNDASLLDGADKAFEDRDYKKAKKMFLKLGNNQDAKYKLALAQINLGELDEAKATLEEVLKVSATHVDAIIALASINSKQKQYDKSLELYSKVLTIDSQNFEGNIESSKIYSKQGDFVKAIEILEKLEEMFQDNSEVAFWLMFNRSNLKNIDNDDDCKQILKDYLSIEEKSDLPSEYHVELAKAYALNGFLDKAFEKCQESLSKTVDDVKTYQLLGLINLVKRDAESAKSHLTTALNIEQSNKETHNLFSYVLCQSVTSCTLPKCRERYFKLVEKYLK